MLLAEFLYDAERSKHVSLKVIGPKLYAYAALVCFRFLGHTVNLNESKGLQNDESGGENVDEFPNLDVAIFSEMHIYLKNWRDGWDGVPNEVEAYLRYTRVGEFSTLWSEIDYRVG